VRSIVGLDRNAAKAVLAEFLAQSPRLNTDQMAFLNGIVEYLVKNGVMEPKVIFLQHLLTTSMNWVLPVCLAMN